MNIHKEGRSFLLKLLVLFILVDVCIVIFLMPKEPVVAKCIVAASVVLYFFFVNFFRNPVREFEGYEDGMVLAPADGTVVVIEPTFEDEYLNEKRIQVSIFMSVLNVHANWYPVNGKIEYYTHNDGNFKRANLPKSSIENERSTVVIDTLTHGRILVRQVAGALARRIVTYAKEGESCSANSQMGFIKFGSRVDLYLPMDSEILVGLKQKVVGNQTVIAKLK